MPEPAVKKTAKDKAALYWLAWGVHLKGDSPSPTECEHDYHLIGPVALGPIAKACTLCGWCEKWGDPKEWENETLSG